MTKPESIRQRLYRQSRGKEYLRRLNLRASHGMTLEQYNEKLEKQNGVCAACCLSEVGRNQYGPVPLAVDHNHETGERRGLLCMRCNRALGMLKDDPNIIRRLYEYRKQYN